MQRQLLVNKLIDDVNAIERKSFVDTVVYARLLRECGELRCFEQGKRVHAHITRSDFVGSVRFYGASGKMKKRELKVLAIKMYGRCGRVEEAKDVFDEMHSQSLGSWTSMISVYAENGHAGEARKMFRSFLLFGPGADPKTLSAALYACLDMGDLEEGHKLHMSIVGSGLERDWRVASSLIRMYGRLGALSDAREVFDQLRVCGVVKLNPWNSMLAVYTQQGIWWEALRLFQELNLEGLQANEATLVTLLSSSCCSTSEACQLVYDSVIDCCVFEDCSKQAKCVFDWNRIIDACESALRESEDALLKQNSP